MSRVKTGASPQAALIGDVGHTKKELAAAEGISASAVSQRASRDGLDLVVVASQYLRSLP